MKPAPKRNAIQRRDAEIAELSAEKTKNEMKDRAGFTRWAGGGASGERGGRCPGFARSDRLNLPHPGQARRPVLLNRDRDSCLSGDSAEGGAPRRIAAPQTRHCHVELVQARPDQSGEGNR